MVKAKPRPFYPRERENWVGLMAGLDRRKNLTQQEFNPRTFQPVARYTV
jgi:hypothetical protein